jgi:hypothetical protein
LSGEQEQHRSWLPAFIELQKLPTQGPESDLFVHRPDHQAGVLIELLRPESNGAGVGLHRQLKGQGLTEEIRREQEDFDVLAAQGWGPGPSLFRQGNECGALAPVAGRGLFRMRSPSDDR